MVWPQITLIVWFALIVVASTINHGKQYKWNAYVGFFKIVTWVWLLYEGGFWNVIINR